jgi:hypothetical protein
MKTANLFNDSIGLTIIKKMDYDGIDAVHNALCFAFYPHGMDDDDEDLDDRFMALWTIFLSSVGWNEGDYWEEYHSRPHTCTCSKHDEEKTILSEDGSKSDPTLN